MITCRRTKTAYQTGDVIRAMKGPKKGRNWHYEDINPQYKVRQTGTAVIALQGTNDGAQFSEDPNPFSPDWIAAPNATWTDIFSTNGNTTGTISAEYEFLRLVMVTPGTGDILECWIRWN